MAGVLAGGLLLAPQSHATVSAARSVVEDVSLAAQPAIIFIDGHDYPYGSERMKYQLEGYYNYQPPTALTKPAAGTNFIFINTFDQYPGTLGLLDGFKAPTGNQSVALGQQSIQDAIADQTSMGNTPITVVGYSLGAVAASHLVSDYSPSDNVSFVLTADPERPNGGILARFCACTYIPFLGISAGGATSSTGAPVVMVTQQYDGVADAPVYVLNVVADANAVLGFVYLHGNYANVDPNASGNIVTTSGNMTDILVPAAAGELPLFRPLAQLGVPQPILVALDPAVRAIVETGYNRTDDPSQQVTFALLPPISAWPGDVHAVVVGFVTTAQELPGAIVASLPGTPAPLTVAPLKTPSPVSSVSLVTGPHLNPALPRLQLASQSQRDGFADQTNGADADAGQQGTPAPLTWTDASQAEPSQPVSAPDPQTLFRPATEPIAVNMKSGNKVAPTSTRGGDGPSSNGSHPLRGALTSVRKAVGSLIGGLKRDTSTDSTSSHAGSGSGDSGPSND